MFICRPKNSAAQQNYYRLLTRELQNAVLDAGVFTICEKGLRF